VAKERLIALVETVQKEGFALKDIALLVRNNAEGRDIFRTLLAYQQSPQAAAGCRYDILSSESLYLGHSPWVNMLINALRCLAEEKAPLAQAELLYLYQLHVLCEAPTALQDCLQTQEHGAPMLEEFAAQRLYLQQLPLYALVEALIQQFQLQGTEAMPFLQAFRDLVLDFVSKESADIPAFLLWWEEEGYRHTLPRASEQDAMTLMTIHQAKGLQFKVVILPFCMWPLDHSTHHPPTLWCATDVPPFNDFPVLPVRYGQRLNETHYAGAYHKEQIQAYLDNLNLLYVALTRPEERLYAFAQRPPKVALKTTADLLYQTLSQLQEVDMLSTSWQACWDEAAGVLAIGSPSPQATAQVVPTALAYHLVPPSLQRGNNRLPFGEVKERSPQASHGQRVHTFLEQLTTLDNWAVVLAAFCKAEEMSQEEARPLERQLALLFSNLQVQDWFSSNWETKNETDILLPSGKVLRPDRVLLQPNKAVVIDFKTGAKHDYHARQVQTYTALLTEMGYAEVEGYLLYLEPGEVVAC
jgi:ATP-dependent exoDNAse (exonuclease V) beta subunit